jgi:hydroxyethylthiazole kinase-like uncharacterized protein yjeF
MTAPTEILSLAEMTACDQAAMAAGTPGIDLMQRGGQAVAKAVMGRWPQGPVLVLCGPGNNGGDGFVAAQGLAQAGWPVRVALTCDLEALKGDAAIAASRWSGPVERLADLKLDGLALVIDAVFGAGLSKPLEPGLVQVFKAIAAAGLPIVAVDVPSGLSGDTGLTVGDYAPVSAVTVSFHRKKPAHVLTCGRQYCGEVVLADIGLLAGTAQVRENTPALWQADMPWPDPRTHKHSRGRMMVVSGEAWNTGAARLAARAGLRVGAGLVTVLSPPDALAINAAHLEAVMLAGFETDIELETAARDADVVVIGPAAGVNPATSANVLALARTGAALVVDADALSVFRHDPDELFSLLDRDDVLTPHPGEFERVFPGLLAASVNRIAAAQAAARKAGAVVLLKGSDTVIAAPSGQCAVNTNGSPWLATAGSGDVLAGLIAGLLAQGMPSFEAACAAVWIHAAAAHSFGPGLIAEDLPGLVPSVLRGLS